MSHRRVRHRLLRAAAPLLGLLAVAVPTAQAAPPWTPAINIGPGASAPVTALSAAGNAVAAGYTTTAVATYRPRTAPAWSATFDSGTAVSTQPSVAAGGDSAVVAYESGGSVYAAVYESGGWGSPAAFGPGTDPRVGMDASGDALLVFIDGTGVVAPAVRPAAGSWSAQAGISLPGADDLDLAVNASGAAVASWRFPATGPQAAVGGTGGFLGSGAAIDPTALSVSDVDAAIGADGTAAVVWVDGGAIRAGYRSGGSWDVATASAGPADSPAVAVDGSGLALAGWRTDAGEVQWSTSANGTWTGTGTTLGAAAAAGSVVATAIGSGSGSVLALGWVAGGAHTAVRLGAGAFDIESHDSGSTASIAVDTAGDVLSVWQGASGARTSTYDSSAPTLTVSVPASAIAGQSVTMTATAADLWSTVNAPSWTFGDGGTGSGFSVGHAWSSAGSKTVTANAIDAAGNAAPQASDSITITATPPVNSGAPTVSGSLYRDGIQLTAGNGSWTGGPTDYSYQWQHCAPGCTDVGSDSQTYTPAAGDVGLTVQVIVTASNSGGSASATSAQTPAIAPQSTNAPGLAGSERDGQTLTADSPAGDWHGVAGVSVAYQWSRCSAAGGGCVDQGGQTGSNTYTLSPADVGSRIVVQAFGSKGGSVQTASADSTPSAIVAPVATGGPPAPSGTTQDGSTLTASTAASQFNNVAGLAYGYQWRRCEATCADIGGATSSTYLLKAADVGATIRVQIDASSNGSLPTSGPESPATGVVTARNTGLPAVTGTLRDGQTLSTTTGSWNGLGAPPLTFARQWERCASDGVTCTPIPAAIGTSYILDPDDVGSRIRVTVTASRNGGATSVTSLVTGAVAPLNTGGAAIGGSGAAADGAQMTISGGNTGASWNNANDLTYTYQWKRCDGAGNNCNTVVGTGTTYTPVAEDVGLRLRLAITATSNGASSTSESATPTAAVAPRQTVGPAVTGGAKDGSALGTDNGNWNGVTGLSHAYLWERCTPSDPAVCGGSFGTGQTRTATAADVGYRFRVRVSASKGASAVTTGAFSAISPVVAPLNSAAPAASLSIARDGGSASTSDGSWNGAAIDTYTRQWQRCDSAGANCADITGANGATYALAASDVGTKVRSVVTASKNGGATAHASAVSVTIAPQNTAPGTIGGTARDGSPLSAASIGEWNGVTGLTPAYTWKRCDGATCTTIAGATGASYVPGAADVGTTIKLAVSASKNGSAVTAGGDSAATGVIAARNTQTPTAAGTTTDGQTLTGSGLNASAWNGAQGLTITQQWVRCDYPAWTTCTAIAGKTDATYVLASEDVDDRIKLRVTASKNGASTEAESALSAVIVPRAPSFGSGGTPFPINQTTGTGTFRIGHTATGSPGPWNGTQPLTFTYSWRSCPSPQHPSACPEVGTGNQFSIPESMLDRWLSFLVTARTSNLYGPQLTAPAPWFSPGTKVADNTLSYLELPVISGTPIDGSTLTTTDPVWDPIHQNNEYSWQRCKSQELPGGECTFIPGASANSYVLTPADVGKYIGVRIRGSYPPDFADAWPEFTTGLVAARPPTNTVAPTVSGTAAIGSVLTAGAGSWDGTPTITFGYQWLRCNAAGAACTPLAGSTDASYSVAADDATHTLRVRVTATNGGGAKSADSAVTAPVPVPPVPSAPPGATTPQPVGVLPPGITPPPPLGAKDRKKPVVFLNFASGTSVRAGARLLVRVTCPKSEASCRGSLVLRGTVLGKGKSLRRGVKVASARFTLKRGKSKTVRLVLAAPAQRMLNARGTLRAELRATAVDAAGNTGLRTKKVTLVRPRNSTLGASGGG